MKRNQKRFVIVFLAVIFMLGMSVQVSAGSKVMYVGQTYRINVSGNYKWSSANKRILRVKGKKITPRKAGKTYIRGIKKAKGKKFVKRIWIVVKNPYINKKRVTLASGKQLKLKVTGTKVLRWKSSDKRIATVSSAGIVKGKKGGTVRITATGKNKKKYTCIVKVKAVQKKTVAVPTATPVQTATPTPIPAPNAYLIGHRGYKTTAPENTFASFRTAVAKGYKAIETDVRFTSDKVPVLLHNATINKTSNGQGYISAMTYEEARTYDFGSWMGEAYAGEQIPNFKEFIEFCKASFVHPYIELKKDASTNYEDIQGLYEIVCAEGMQQNVSWFSFDYDYMLWMKEIAPTADIGIVLPGKASLGITEDVFGKLENLKTGINTVFVSDYARKISPAVLLRCKEEEIDLVARDITSMEEWYALDPYYRAAFADAV